MTRIIIADISEISEENHKKIYQLLEHTRKKVVDSYMFEQDRSLSALSEFCLYYLVSLECRYDNNLFVKEYFDNGKPWLVNKPEIFFSVSHSGTKCIVCVSNEHKIGVDIECLSRYKDRNLTEDIINFFDKEELALIEIGKDCLEQALVLWTKKEAIFKSKGTGSLREILKKKLTKEQLNEIESFICDGYIISIANNSHNSTILDARSIGVEKMIQHIKIWKS